jgi:hypothetical protein
MAIPTKINTVACIHNAPAGHGSERNHHDFSGKYEVSTNGAGDLLILKRLRISSPWRGDFFGLVRYMWKGLFGELLGPLEAKIGAAGHQQRRNRAGGEGAKYKRRRGQKQQLVAKGPEGDFRHDGKLARAGESDNIAWRYSGIVNDHSCSLHTRLCPLSDYVVERGSRDLRNCGYIVQECYQSDAHLMSLRSAEPGSFMNSSETPACFSVGDTPRDTYQHAQGKLPSCYVC